MCVDSLNVQDINCALIILNEHIFFITFTPNKQQNTATKEQINKMSLGVV